MVRVAWQAHALRAVRGCSVGEVAIDLFPCARGAVAGNSIVDASAVAIAEALKVNMTVTEINLYGACRAAGARAVRGARLIRTIDDFFFFYDVLTSARGLVAGNSIGDASAVAIAEALKLNDAVTRINLSCACRTLLARGAACPRRGISCGSRSRGARPQGTLSATRVQRLSRRR